MEMQIHQKFSNLINLSKSYKQIENLFLQFQQETVNLDVYKMLTQLQHDCKNKILNLFVFKVFINKAQQINIFNEKNVYKCIIKLYICKELTKQNESIQIQDKVYQLCLISFLIQIIKLDKSLIPEAVRAIEKILLFCYQINEQEIQVFNEIYEHSLILKNDNSNKSSLLYYTLKLLKNLTIQTNHDQNFEKIYSHMKDILSNFNVNNQQVQQLINNQLNQFEQSFDDYKLKQPLQILKEQSLMKIKQLTPRLGKTDYQKQLGERKKLQSKVKKLNKTIVKEVKQDQAILNSKDQQNLQFRKQLNQQSYKNFKNQIYDGENEVKKLKTMQIKIERTKKKRNLKAGKKQ